MHGVIIKQQGCGLRTPEGGKWPGKALTRCGGSLPDDAWKAWKVSSSSRFRCCCGRVCLPVPRTFRLPAPTSVPSPYHLPRLSQPILLPVRSLPNLARRILLPVGSLPHPARRILLPVRSLPHLARRILLPVRSLPHLARRILLPVRSLPSLARRIFLPVRSCLSLDCGTVFPVGSLREANRRPFLASPSFLPLRRRFSRTFPSFRPIPPISRATSSTLPLNGQIPLNQTGSLRQVEAIPILIYRTLPILGTNPVSPLRRLPRALPDRFAPDSETRRRWAENEDCIAGSFVA